MVLNGHTRTRKFGMPCVQVLFFFFSPPLKPHEITSISQFAPPQHNFIKEDKWVLGI